MASSPSGSIRVVRVNGSGGVLPTGSTAFIYARPEDFWAMKASFRAEDTQFVDTKPQVRWTEFNKTLFWFLGLPAVLDVLYIIDHTDLVYNGANDLLLPARYDTEILNSAYSFLTTILVKD